MLNPENPCHGCQTGINGNARRAPCCWNLKLTMPYQQYMQEFQGQPGVENVQFKTDEWMGEEAIVAINGPCPKLDTDSGACTIENHKPLACRQMEPYKDPKCIKTP